MSLIVVMWFVILIILLLRYKRRKVLYEKFYAAGGLKMEDIKELTHQIIRLIKEKSKLI